MKFSHPRADVFVPTGGDATAALARVTHLCVAAHQDDIEILAHAGICDCLDGAPAKAFGGVVVTNGAGSPRTGPYAHLTDEQMQDVRREEQRKAAQLGRYAIQLQLAHPSADVKRAGHPGVVADLRAIFAGCTPEVVYLHNPADKHDTHVAVLLRCLEAIRSLPAAQRPKRVLGAEVWRDLDWLLDADKVALDAGRHVELAGELMKVFDSQVTGGKRYDLAALGRRLAHATFHTSHATDKFKGITWAMDLTPLIADPKLDIAAYTLGYLDRLRDDVASRLKRFS
ncbi:PIG-L family deacetylase [Opitutus sp. ER46]|uniref:PIG-L deacetylase family protein n=1 Tax=Opitutus sp. ER46 TaxID=2161864 RepID=UPI000D325DF6|nr:PIG-L family deacetylase [Opitutus sp. ER46]PTX91531.1 PIG-L family deacetylase [Opitutus sp. ER46]